MISGPITKKWLNKVVTESKDERVVENINTYVEDGDIISACALACRVTDLPSPSGQFDELVELNGNRAVLERVSALLDDVADHCTDHADVSAQCRGLEYAFRLLLYLHRCDSVDALELIMRIGVVTYVPLTMSINLGLSTTLSELPPIGKTQCPFYTIDDEPTPQVQFLN